MAVLAEVDRYRSPLLRVSAAVGRDAYTMALACHRRAWRYGGVLMASEHATHLQAGIKRTLDYQLLFAQPSLHPEEHSLAVS